MNINLSSTACIPHRLLESTHEKARGHERRKGSQPATSLLVQGVSRLSTSESIAHTHTLLQAKESEQLFKPKMPHEAYCNCSHS